MLTQPTNIKQQIPVNGIQDIDYQGKVDIKIVKGNTVLKNTTYYNNGTPTLFRFLCSCLAGSYAENLRPCKIKFFSYNEANKNPQVVNFNWDACFQTAGTSPTEITPPIMYEATPLLKYVAAEITADGEEVPAHYETTFHFRVPFSMISGDYIHMVGIYPTNAMSNAQASAYYLFTNERADGFQYWEPLDLSGINGNFSIILDWTMSIANKSKIITANRNSAALVNK